MLQKAKDDIWFYPVICCVEELSIENLKATILSIGDNGFLAAYKRPLLQFL